MTDTVQSESIYNAQFSEIKHTLDASDLEIKDLPADKRIQQQLVIDAIIAELDEEKQLEHNFGTVLAALAAQGIRSINDARYRKAVREHFEQVLKPLLEQQAADHNETLLSRIKETQKSLSTENIQKDAFARGRTYVGRRKNHRNKIKYELKKQTRKVKGNTNQLAAIAALNNPTNIKQAQAALAAITEQLSYENSTIITQTPIPKQIHPETIKAVIKRHPEFEKPLATLSTAYKGTIPGELIPVHNHVSSAILSGSATMSDVIAIERIALANKVRVGRREKARAADTASDIFHAFDDYVNGKLDLSEAPFFREILKKYPWLKERYEKTKQITQQQIEQPTPIQEEIITPQETPAAAPSAQTQKLPRIPSFGKQRKIVERLKIPRPSSLQTLTKPFTRFGTTSTRLFGSFIRNGISILRPFVSQGLKTFGSFALRGIILAGRTIFTFASQISSLLSTVTISIVGKPIIGGIAAFIIIVLIIFFILPGFSFNDGNQLTSFTVTEKTGTLRTSTNLGLVASGNCPLIGNPSIKTGSYDAAAETGHGSNAYWGGKSSCEYSIPIQALGGCRGPDQKYIQGSQGNVCANESNVCPEYGFAIDVVSDSTVVALPAICEPGSEPCPDLSWKIQDGWFNCSGSSKHKTRTSCRERDRDGNGTTTSDERALNEKDLWGYGIVFTTTDTAGNRYLLYLNHIDPASQLMRGPNDAILTTGNTPLISGTTIGTITKDNVAHLHIELSKNGVPIRPDFLCGGDSFTYDMIAQQLDQNCTQRAGTTYCYPISTDPTNQIYYPCGHGASSECANLPANNPLSGYTAHLQEPYAAVDVLPADGLITTSRPKAHLPLFAYTDGEVIDTITNGDCTWTESNTCQVSPDNTPEENDLIERSGDCCPIGGNRVKIRGDDQRYYFYAHMDNVVVSIGDRVTAGQLIGHTGTTGRGVRNEHVHFGISFESTFETQICSYYLENICLPRYFVWPQPEFQELFGLSCNQQMTRYPAPTTNYCADY